MDFMLQAWVSSRSVAEKSRRDVTRSGRPLDSGLRRYFEPRFAHDFSRVRVHTDAGAAASAYAIGARAYASGADIVFGAGQYAPRTLAGRTLLAHELAHVIQQGDVQPRPTISTDARAEHQARVASRTVTAGGTLASGALSPADGSVQRDVSLPSLPQRDAGAEDLAGAPTQSAMSTIEQFFHGTTWRIAQQLPRNVKAIGGGDFGQGFYTHHDDVQSKAEGRAKDWAVQLARSMEPPERYAGVVRFDVPKQDYLELFNQRKYFGLTSTKQKDFAARQKDWLDFVSGPRRGREAMPTFDARTGAWRHQRRDPPPDLDYQLIEGPFYRGVPGLPGADEPERSAFKPFAEGTTLPQQVVWNHKRALDVLNAAPTKLTQYDATEKDPKPIDPPHAVAPLNMSVAEDAKASEKAQRVLTRGP